MSLEFELPLVSLFFILLLFVVYVFKMKINLIENKCFLTLLIFSLLEVILDTVIHFIGSINSYQNLFTKFNYTFANWINKFIVLFFIIIFTSLLDYLLIISYKKIKSNTTKLFKYNKYLYVVCMIVLFFTNIKIIRIGNVTNIQGSTMIFGYSIVAVLLFLSLLITIFNFNKYDKRYFPAFFINVCLILFYVITIFFPGIIFYDVAIVLLCYTMYFTIENPDMKLLTIAEENRKIALKGFEEKSNLLFQISQEVKNPINNIEKYSEVIKNSKDIKENIYFASKINLESRNLNILVNNVLDLSGADINKIKIIKNKYNINNLFKELELKYNTNDKIKYVFNISSVIPKYLYGDSLKLKQVLSKILDYYVNHMKKGIINIDVKNIEKYEVCRLIITIGASGFNLDIKTINNILNNEEELSEEEFDNLDNVENNMQLVNKIIKIIGGSMIIRSDNNYCETVIALDQKIDEINKETIVFDDHDEIILVDDKISSINKIKRYLKAQDVTISMYGLDLINRIKHGEIYKLILLDDEMEPMNGYTVMNKLKEIKDFNIPVIILINRSKEIIKDKYKDIGFKDYIFKDDLDNEMKKINKYI